jgi:PAS domain S-box-containing protein
MNEGLGKRDENGIITYVNEKLCNMFGYSYDEMIGRHVYSFHDEANLQILKEQMASRKTGEKRPYEIQWIRKDGQKMDMLVSPQPLFDESGAYRGSFAVFTALLGRHDIAAGGEIRSHGTLHCILEDIKTSFIFYDTILSFPALQFNSLSVADWRDIAAEKVRIAADREQKKDFYDLYFSLRLLGIEPLLELYVKKFGKSVNYFHILKGMTYFEDAEKDPEPMLVDKSVTWDEVTQFFLSHIKEFERAFEKLI